MSDITIQKVTGCSQDCSLQHIYFPSGQGSACSPSVCSPPAGTYYTWQQTYLFKSCDSVLIRNFDSIDIELRTPVGDFPIPELRDTCNILVKAEGNGLNVRVAFTVKDEIACCSIFSPGACSCAQAILTVQEQLCFWVNSFQPNSMEDGYIITIDGVTRLGTVKNLSFSKSASTPVTYIATLDFVAGNIVAGES